MRLKAGLPARRILTKLNGDVNSGHKHALNRGKAMAHRAVSGGEKSRLEEIRRKVERDYRRIAHATDPYLVLNLNPGASLADVREQYAEYEEFYQVDRFHQFADVELTRRALDIRRSLGRAMVAINNNQKYSAMKPSVPLEGLGGGAPELDPDFAALGDIYFRDGLTYLKLRDLNAAEDCLQRAIDYDPTRGIVLAYLSYARFKLRNHDPSVVEECGRQLERAAQMDPKNVEVQILSARYGINIGDKAVAKRALARAARLRPDHPKLAGLKARLSQSA